MRTWFFDRDGRPLDAVSWAVLANDAQYVIVAADFAGRRGYVETRWDGRDRNDSGDGPPLIYVTTVTIDRHQVEQDSTSTLAGALAAHRRAVRRLRWGHRLDRLAGLTIGITVVLMIIYAGWR